MKRLTTDNPQGNFETMLNYVFGKDGCAYIRSDGESEEPVALTEWARKQCVARGCDGMYEIEPDLVDTIICDCAFSDADCPVFLAYIFACQAVHMRDRCKVYEEAIPFAELPRAAELYRAEKQEREKKPGVDVARVVRCKECKRSGITEFGKRYCKEPLGMYGCVPVEDDSFCSHGKRKDDAE